MKKYSRLYCKLYVDIDINEQELSKIIADLIHGKMNGRDVRSDILDTHTNKNLDFNCQKENKLRNDFLFYRYFLDVEPAEKNISQNTYIFEIETFLQKLWDRDIKAVISCEFEEELSRFGGYNYEKRSKKII